MIFWIVGGLLYAFFGIINAITIAICIAEDSFRSSNPLEYWLALIICFFIWPYFLIKTMVEAIKTKNNGKH